MAKKPQKTTEDESQQRQSRKEMLIARKHERQLRNIRIAGITVAVLIGLVIVLALIMILFINPSRAVATVGDTSITLREWQERVKFERAQRIIYLENQLEAFGGDVGVIQQFFGQLIDELYDPEGMGQSYLNLMADEKVICQALEERGIEITDVDVQSRIGQTYGFYGEGVSPTPLPEPTRTVVPTPSITPIPTAVITDVVPTETPFPTATIGPDPTPLPTATPVPEEEYLNQYGQFIASLNDLGVDEATYQSVIRAQLCRERLTEELTAERELSRTAPHASLFVISAGTEEEANEVQALAETEGFLTAWNTIQSRPADPEAEEAPTTNAFELLWRTSDGIESAVGADVAAAAFELDINTPSDLIPVENSDGATTYYLIMVSGREERELSESEFQTRQSELLQTFVDEQLTGNLQINELWRTNNVTLPALDPKFLAAPTATPEIETAPTVVPEATVEE
jgi:hypothetical protein